MTSAIHTLTKNLTRAGYFLDLHERWQPGAGAPNRAARELPRGAVVFAVGAFDTYLADVVGEVLITRAQAHISGGEARDLMKRVHTAVPGLALELVLDPDQNRRIDRMQQAVVTELQNTAWHGSNAVSKAMRYIDRPVRGVWDLAEADGFPAAASNLDDWTSKRHDIVHRGQAVRIQRKQARSCIQLVTALGAAIDYQADESIRA